MKDANDYSILIKINTELGFQHIITIQKFKYINKSTTDAYPYELDKHVENENGEIIYRYTW